MASEPPSPSGQGPLPLAVALTPTLPSAGIDHFIKYFPLLQCVALMLNYQNVFGLQTKKGNYKRDHSRHNRKYSRCNTPYQPRASENEGLKGALAKCSNSRAS